MDDEQSTTTAAEDEPRLDLARDVTINVRVSAEEKARIVRRAKSLGLGASTFLRSLGLGAD